MTDEQIIKALECCGVELGSCEKCPSKYRRRGDCIRLLTIDAINLINRQQAEIDHFAEANKMVIEPKTIKTEDEEILRILVNQSVTFIPKNDDIKAIQRDAAINFADRLKSKCRDSVELDDYRMTVVTKSDIDKAVNEMFGNPEQVKGEENG